MSWSFWQFVGVWLGLSTIPYAMFLVAYVFESRLPGIGPDRIPVWRYQSRAFLPGDFGLTLFVTSGLCLFDQASRGQRTCTNGSMISGRWWLRISCTTGRSVGGGSGSSHRCSASSSCMLDGACCTTRTTTRRRPGAHLPSAIMITSCSGCSPWRWSGGSSLGTLPSSPG